MSNKTRSTLKVIAVILVLVAVAIRFGWVSIPAINGFNFWFVVIGFALVLVSSR